MGSTGQPPSLKRRDSSVNNREEDQLIVTPLGAGNEVGRSCVYMTYKGKTILVFISILAEYSWPSFFYPFVFKVLQIELCFCYPFAV